MIALSGVRSSWLMFARNWLLARLAASAASFALRSASSARLCGVMLCRTATPLCSTPSSSLSGVALTLTQRPSGTPELRMKTSAASPACPRIACTSGNSSAGYGVTVSGQVEAEALRPHLGRRLRQRAVQDALGGGIEEDEPSLLVGDDDAVAHAVEDRLQDPRLLLERVLGSRQFAAPLFGRRAALGHALLERGVQGLELLLGPETLGDLLLQLSRTSLKVLVDGLQGCIALLDL